MKVVTWLVVAFTVFMMIFTVFTVATVDKNHRSIFGTKFYIVKTDSMSPSDKNKDMDVHFNAGDIILAKKVDDIYALESGDIISFISTNADSYGETITHMIRRREYSNEGKFIGYVTFGTNTDTNDEAIVEPEYILGEYSGKIPQIGKFFAFVKTTPGYIVCILVPFLILIAYNGYNVIRLFRQYKREQTEDMRREREEIEAQRRQNEDMLRELQALKAQLESQNALGENEQPPETTNDEAIQDLDQSSEEQ